MSGVDESGVFDPIPEGKHYAKITEIVPSTSKNGDPMFAVKLTLRSGPNQDEWCWDNIIIPKPDSPAIKILGRSKHFLHAIGQPYDGEIEYDTEDWLWKAVSIDVKHEEYKGKIRAKVANYIIEEESPPEEEPEL